MQIHISRSCDIPLKRSNAFFVLQRVYKLRCSVDRLFRWWGVFEYYDQSKKEENQVNKSELFALFVDLVNNLLNDNGSEGHNILGGDFNIILDKIYGNFKNQRKIVFMFG